MGGNQSRALRVIAKAKGWDAGKVEGFSGADADFANWDKDPGAYRSSGNGLGTIPDAPAVNSGSRSVRARDPRQPGGSGDPSEGAPIAADRAVPFNYPGRSAQRSNLAPDGGIRQGMDLMSGVPWNSPTPSYTPPAIGKVGRRSSERGGL